MARLRLCCLLIAMGLVRLSIEMDVVQRCYEGLKNCLRRETHWYDVEGPCGDPPPLPDGMSRYSSAGIARSRPWLGHLAASYHQHHQLALVALIRSMGHANKSNLAVTTAHMCSLEIQEHGVIFGTRDLRFPSIEFVRIKKCHPHPDYNAETGANDFALLELQTYVQFTDNIKPVCLPKPNRKVKRDTIGYVTGRGESSDVYLEKDLREITFRVVSMAECNPSSSNIPNTRGMACLGVPPMDWGRNGFHQNNQGGPFVTMRSGIFELAALLMHKRRAGAPGYPVPILATDVSTVMTSLSIIEEPGFEVGR